MDREAWHYSPWGCKELDATERLTHPLSSLTSRSGWPPLFRGLPSSTDMLAKLSFCPAAPIFLSLRLPSLFIILSLLFLGRVGAALDLHCCSWGLSSDKRGLLFVAVPKLLTAVTSHVGECQRVSVVAARRLGICSPRAGAQKLRHTAIVARWMWNLPRPGVKPMSPALAGEFLPTVPPGKSLPTQSRIMTMRTEGLNLNNFAWK